MQNKLPLFESEVVEKHLELSFESKVKEQFGHKFLSRSVYIRRGQKGKIDKGFDVPNNRDYTFIHIAGLNVLGQRGSTDFRFITDTDGLPCNGDVLIPELNNLPKKRLVEFIENVIQRIVDGEFEWDYENRNKIYSNKIHCDF